MRAIVHDVIFNRPLRLLSWPNLKPWILAGEKTIAASIACLWAVEDLDKEFGGGFIENRMIKGVNHLVSMLYITSILQVNALRIFQMHWDHPELTMQVYLDCLRDNFQESLYVNF
jgi:hypothetical protein